MKLLQDDITRCVECNLICLLKLNYKEGKPLINYECENGHKGNILLKDYNTINFQFQKKNIHMKKVKKVINIFLFFKIYKIFIQIL